AEVEPVVPSVVPVVVSARSEAALRAQAERLRAHVAGRSELSLVDVGFSAAVSRAHLEHRAAVVATDRGALLSGLESLALGEPAGHVLEGRQFAGRPVFVFPGQG
ncbi:hypothetical protein, partial [Streptomyces sp. JJ38]|uniref:CurL C-terminal domain-containing protein n=1 Tax=Streptomyces sp. JJ38 TaxID=2738128 RepID=UPI001C55B9B7